ncbi:MAG: urea ABC transporter ATP-binding protein UrtD [Cohnella sp.]|jgi:urea transport system ATP-binding protein|uniref:urea ABC transporter ATP-binding protein UrtD n=1 Tax=Cohnella sp. TaxID=1883426 RepID=UPI000E3AF616|nr:urea ABC transporter ATP-binding protein UrtD [Cohnella sp.]REK68657.1 MAG: urea ABC transporter ATP-binding protein UrtD [Cohnella sp.]
MKPSLVLSLEKVTVSFDGFHAVKEMDFSLTEGELRFLIGPNGAGKTTLLDAICGKVKPASGKMLYYPEHRAEPIDIARKEEHRIAELGIGRKFQAPSVFSNLTVRDNMEIAMSQKRGIMAALFAKTTAEQREMIERELELIGLADKASWRAGSLSHGEKQWLEIGMMLIQGPRVLLLDEPVAGMTDRETDKTGELLQEIAKKRTVVVVEHDMEFVRKFSSRVTVMHEGSLLAEGTIEEVRADARVAEVYLGKKAV